MATYLDGIVAWHRARVAADGRDPAALRQAAEETTACDPPRDFAGSLRSSPEVAVVAEIKRRSPSQGDLDPGLDAAVVASEYEAGGATCLSVLTDSPHFGGSAEDLAAARAATALPVLRKDFTLSAPDVYDARLMGADAVLLIVAVLGEDELGFLLEEAGRLSMTALVEVHDETEAARAEAAGASVVGVNQRDLHTFEVDPGRAVHLAANLAWASARLAESGISCVGDVERLGAAGFDGVLVGEHLVRAADRRAAVSALSVRRTAADRCG